jgi:hypothetical protein
LPDVLELSQTRQKEQHGATLKNGEMAGKGFGVKGRIREGWFRWVWMKGEFEYW